MWTTRQHQNMAFLGQSFKWLKPPYIVGAPMRVLAGPELAVEISLAGGLGFIGPPAKIEDASTDLKKAADLLRQRRSGMLPDKPSAAAANTLLPVGIGFQTWATNLDKALSALEAGGPSRPCAVWLFAPRHGQRELDEWTRALRSAQPDAAQVWVQVGTLREAMEAAASDTPPDVLVIQGAEAGGHGRATDGVGLQTLLPEVASRTSAMATAAGTGSSGIPLVAAGGISDGRGVAAALSLGACGAAMGTRFLAAREARIARGYQDEVLRLRDGGSPAVTVRTQLYNHLRGTFGWPEQFAPRAAVNRSWQEHSSGVPFEELKRRHDEAVSNAGDGGWGPDGRLATYVGASVGLIEDVQPAATLVSATRDEARSLLTSIVAMLDEIK